MKQLLHQFVTLVAFVTLLLLAQGNANELNKEDILTKVRQQYSTIQTLKASFKQTSYQAMLKENVTEEGWVALQKPDKLIWNYLTPTKKIAFLDGTFVWFYVPEDHHLYCEESDSYAQNLFYRLIAGDFAVLDTFNTTLVPIENESTETKPSIQLKLIPVDTHPTIDYIIVDIDNQQFLISKTVVFDHFGNKTTCLLNDYKTNISLESDTFSLTVTRPLTITDFMGNKKDIDIIDKSRFVSWKQ